MIYWIYLWLASRWQKAILNSPESNLLHLPKQHTTVTGTGTLTMSLSWHWREHRGTGPPLPCVLQPPHLHLHQVITCMWLPCSQTDLSIPRSVPQKRQKGNGWEAHICQFSSNSTWDRNNWLGHLVPDAPLMFLDNLQKQPFTSWKHTEANNMAKLPYVIKFQYNIVSEK